MLRTFLRGWEVEWTGNWIICGDGEVVSRGGKWVYCDTGEEWRDQRPCRKCGRFPTPEGYDACLGYIPGAKSVCCGHGNDRNRILMFYEQLGP